MAKYEFKSSPIDLVNPSYDLVVIGAGGTGLSAALNSAPAWLFLKRTKFWAGTPARLHQG